MFTGFHLARCSNGSCAIEVHVCQSGLTFFQRDNTGYIFFVCLFVFLFISNRAPSIPYATEDDLTGIPRPEFTNKLFYQ